MRKMKLDNELSEKQLKRRYEMLEAPNSIFSDCPYNLLYNQIKTIEKFNYLPVKRINDIVAIKEHNHTFIFRINEYHKQAEVITTHEHTSAFRVKVAKLYCRYFENCIKNESFKKPESVILLPKIEPESEQLPEPLQEIIQDSQRGNVLSRILNPLKKGLSFLRFPILKKIS